MNIESVFEDWLRHCFPDALPNQRKQLRIAFYSGGIFIFDCMSKLGDASHSEVSKTLDDLYSDFSKFNQEMENL